MPRVKLFDQDEALNKAMELFWEKGYASTSLLDLTEHLGISKGSFYDTFYSKRIIFEKAFELYRLSNIEMLTVLFNSEPNVKKGIRKLFEFNLEQAINDSRHKGCFVANTCSELGGSDMEMKTVLTEHHKNLHKSISGYLKKGNFTKDLDIENITDYFITFLTGLNQEVKFKTDKSKILKSIDLVLQVLD